MPQPNARFSPETGTSTIRNELTPDGGWSAQHLRQHCPVWWFNPWTGKARDPRDVEIDPQGLAIWYSEWGPLLAAPKITPAPVDMVNLPPHYGGRGVECIQAIEAALTPEEYRGYLKGNVMKYVWRERQKGGTESMLKAEWYLKRLLGSDC